MSRNLSELLSAEEPLFSLAIKQLEQATGNQSADIRLYSEIIRKAHGKMRELGLDPKDTTGKELYLALLEIVKKHDHFLVSSVGGKDPEDVEDILPRLKKLVDGLDMPKKVWVLKPSVAKRLLKATPPQNVMKHLGYKSVDSMIKREPIMELYGALRFAEDAKWLDRFIGKYKKLAPSDFESRDIEIKVLDAKKWGQPAAALVNKNRHNLTHLKELGVILILPMPVKRMRGAAITVLPLLLHYVNEIRVYSAFFKMQQVKPDFGSILVDTIIADPGKHATMAGHNIHWRVIQRYFGKLEGTRQPDIFQPHVQPEDLYWRKAEEVLYRIEPALHFWKDMDYVALMHDGRPTSFSLMDTAISYVNGLSYENRAMHHFRSSLWNEIYIRYMGQTALENQIIKQLDNEMISPDLMPGL